MSKKLISLLVSNALVLFLCGTSVPAGSNEDKAARYAEKIKAGISKLGTGATARVEVKLRDKTKLKGYVSEISDNHFVVIDDRTGAAITVAYPQVKQVKGNNLSTGAKIAIGIGVVALLVLFAFAVSDHRAGP